MLDHIPHTFPSRRKQPLSPLSSKLGNSRFTTEVYTTDPHRLASELESEVLYLHRIQTLKSEH